MIKMYNCDYEDYEDYGFEEDDLLTNFNEDKLPIYKMAIEEYGDDTLYIDEEAYDRRGNKITGYYALRTYSNKDRSSFWSIYRSIEKQYQ
jgi:hypothetical protein